MLPSFPFPTSGWGDRGGGVNIFNALFINLRAKRGSHEFYKDFLAHPQKGEKKHILTDDQK